MGCGSPYHQKGLRGCGPKAAHLSSSTLAALPARNDGTMLSSRQWAYSRVAPVVTWLPRAQMLLHTNAVSKVRHPQRLGNNATLCTRIT